MKERIKLDDVGWHLKVLARGSWMRMEGPTLERSNNVVTWSERNYHLVPSKPIAGSFFFPFFVVLFVVFTVNGGGNVG